MKHTILVLFSITLLAAQPVTSPTVNFKKHKVSPAGVLTINIDAELKGKFWTVAIKPSDRDFVMAIDRSAGPGNPQSADWLADQIAVTDAAVTIQMDKAARALIYGEVPATTTLVITTRQGVQFTGMVGSGVRVIDGKPDSEPVRSLAETMMHSIQQPVQLPDIGRRPSDGKIIVQMRHIAPQIVLPPDKIRPSAETLAVAAACKCSPVANFMVDVNAAGMVQGVKPAGGDSGLIKSGPAILVLARFPAVDWNGAAASYQTVVGLTTDAQGNIALVKVW